MDGFSRDMNMNGSISDNSEMGKPAVSERTEITELRPRPPIRKWRTLLSQKERK